MAGGKLIWFTAGVAVGAAVGLLCAPVSGQEMRQKIADITDQGRTALAEHGGEIFEKGKRMIEKGRRIADEAAELFERGRNLMEGVVGNA
jgi:gas vesicle protein